MTRCSCAICLALAGAPEDQADLPLYYEGLPEAVQVVLAAVARVREGRASPEDKLAVARVAEQCSDVEADWRERD